MAKKYFALLEKINTDQFSNKAAGLEDDNIFNAVSEDPTTSVDSINEEVEDQLNKGDDEGSPEVTDDMFSSNDVEDDDSYEPTLTDDEKEWEDSANDANDQLSKKPEDCINIMEIISSYQNNYRKIFVELASDSLLEGTGDFTNYKYFNEVEDVFKDLTAFYNEEKNTFYQNLNAFRQILMNKEKMTSICGTKKAPFLYEGLQLAYLAQLHNLIIATPYKVKLSSDFNVAIETMGIDKDIKFFDRVLCDALEAAPVLGSKIKFTESVKSEITGRSETINETVYANSDIISDGQDEIVTDFEYAGESIQNLMEMKNDKVLLEYNALIRDCSLVVTYLKAFGPQENWINSRKLVYALLKEEDDSKVQELLVKTCSELDKVLTDMAKAYKLIIKES